MDARARTGLAVAGGYLLGRTKKAKLALTFAGLMAGRKLNGAGGLLGQGAELLRSPEFEQLRDDVRGRLMGAGKSAALATASKTMQRATARLSAPPELEDEDEDEPDEEVEEERPRRRSRSRRSEHRGDGDESESGSRSRPARRREPQKAQKAPAKRASSASKRPAKKAAKKAAKKTAKAPARKSTSSTSSRRSSSRGTSGRSRRNG